MKAGEWKKAAEAAKEELDEFQEGSRLGTSIARLLSPFGLHQLVAGWSLLGCYFIFVSILS